MEATVTDAVATTTTTQTECVSEAVVLAVADAKGVEPLDLQTQLYDVVDPDALDRLFEPRADGTPRTGGRVEFTMAGFDVVVRADGDVSVTAPEADALSR